MEARMSSLAGLIPDAGAMAGLVEALRAKGFTSDQFGLLTAGEHDEGFLALAGHPENEGTIEGTIFGGLTYLGALTGLGVTIFGGGGFGLALAALAGAGGAGAFAGLLAAAGFHRAHANRIVAGLGQRRLLAWITPRDPSQVEMARDLLTAAGAPELMECALPGAP